MTSIDELVRGRERTEADAQFGRVYRGKVTKATADTLHFVVPAIDPQVEFGPAPYPAPPAATGETGGGSGDGLFDPHDHDLRDPNNPPKGTTIAVAFADGDVSDPLVLAVYGWPT